MFKHPLTQEVVYNGLPKKERQDIHEQIALVMEQIFQERLPEFYETLAFHFLRGRSTVKAVEYLMLSGRKSLSRYAVEGADQYFREAFRILDSKAEKTDAEKLSLIDVINDWSFVYYYLGNMNSWIDVMNAHQELAESSGADARLGMFCGWLGTPISWEEDQWSHLITLRKPSILEKGAEIRKWSAMRAPGLRGLAWI